MADPAKERYATIQLKTVTAPAGWDAWLLPVSTIPMPEQELTPVRKFCETVTVALMKERSLNLETLIQMEKIHLGDGPDRLADNGREWIPAMGLGVWPDREPPTLWTREEFEALDVNEMPRTLMYQVFRVTTDEPARHAARDRMIGLGTVLEVLTRDDSDKFLQRARDFLLPPIKEKSFSCFPFYVPLLEAKSFSSASAEQLEDWFCGAGAYLRESPEDEGILIAARDSLDELFGSLKGKKEPGPEPVWNFSIPL